MTCCICYERSNQKTPCGHNICFNCVYHLIEKDNKERILNYCHGCHNLNNGLNNKWIKTTKKQEAKNEISSYVFNCPYCRQLIIDSKYLKKVIKNYVEETVEFYKNKIQYTKDFIYLYYDEIGLNEKKRYFKVIKEENENVEIIELLIKHCKEEYDEKTGITYKYNMVIKNNTIGKPITIKKSEVQDYKVIKNVYVRDDEYRNINYWAIIENDMDKVRRENHK